MVWIILKCDFSSATGINLGLCETLKITIVSSENKKFKNADGLLGANPY